MSKKDLCDYNETKKWINYYEEKGYMVLCMNIEKEFNKKLFISKIKDVMDDINIKRKAKGLKERKARLLVIGIPNVGKSTLINRLVGKKVVNVGNKPGVTKSLDWIRIDNYVELLDTPGILWPKFEEKSVAFNLASLTAIKEEVLPIYDVVVYILKTLEKYYPEILEKRYGITSISKDIVETLDNIGKRRGCLSRGGIVDYEKVYGIILNDIKTGIVKGITFDRYEEC